MHGTTLTDDRCQAGAVDDAWYAELAGGGSRVAQPAAVLDEERAHAQAEPTPDSSGVRYERDVTSFHSVDLTRSAEPHQPTGDASRCRRDTEPGRRRAAGALDGGCGRGSSDRSGAVVKIVDEEHGRGQRRSTGHLVQPTSLNHLPRIDGLGTLEFGQRQMQDVGWVRQPGAKFAALRQDEAAQLVHVDRMHEWPVDLGDLKRFVSPSELLVESVSVSLGEHSRYK